VQKKLLTPGFDYGIKDNIRKRVALDL